MAVYTFPSVVIHDLETLFRDFLWAHGESSKGKCRIAWSQVCKPKEAGGLGFKLLAVWNRALIANHLWDIALPKDSLWVRWIQMHYLRGSNLWIANPNARWSWVLRKIMKLRPQIRPFIKSAVGDGARVNSWEDDWLPCGRLSAFVSYRFIHSCGFSMGTSVRDIVHDMSRGFMDEWISWY